MTYSELQHDHLCEALVACQGFIHGARKYIKAKWGYGICNDTVKKRIVEWGMEDWLSDIRKSLVEECLQKTFAKAIEKGDNQCIFWVLEKYGHHIDFVDAKLPEPESEKGWKVILSHVKADPERDSEEEHS